METSNKFNKKIKLIIFDQYGTIVDMQKGLTEAVIPFLKKKKMGWGSQSVRNMVAKNSF